MPKPFAVHVKLQTSRIWPADEYVPGDLVNAHDGWQQHKEFLEQCPPLECIFMLGKYGTFRSQLMQAATKFNVKKQWLS